jgi:hypothetical protein
MSLLHGVSCHLFPQTVLEQMTNMGASRVDVDKRQTDADDAAAALQQCALDRFDAVFQGNNSRFVMECRATAVLENELNFTTAQLLQSDINDLYRIFCTPECGNVFLDAYDVCGAFENPEERSYLAGLCGSNDNGNFCYEIFLDSFNLLWSAYSCAMNSEECVCGDLSEGVRRQGCCVDNLHELVVILDDVFGDFVPKDVYGNCSVSLPEAGCPSPLRRNTITAPATTQPAPATTQSAPGTTQSPPPRGSSSLPQATIVSSVAIIILTLAVNAVIY